MSDGEKVVSSKHDRNLAWVLSWLAYATFYTGRKGFSVAKKSIHDELGVSVGALGLIDSLYTATYSAGQFVSGFFGDRIGARRLVGYGLFASAACCAAFGASRAFILFAALFCLNGFAQSTGWPGTTRAMAEWTTRKNRGTVMAFWATCYQVGGLFATFFAGYLLVRFGWPATFYGPAILMAMVGLLVLTLLKPGPSGDHAVTQPSVASESRGPVIPAASDRELRAQAQRAVLKSPLLWCYGTSYFFIKFIRYTLLFWLPFYLSKALGYRGDIAAYVSTAFEAGGVVGVIAIGMLSDRLRRRSRAFVAIPTLVALAAVLFAHSVMSSASIAYNVAFFAAVGFALFGPDALISGAASQDAGGPHAAATATGFVNGLGSLGPILVGPVVDGIQKSLGWGALFTALGAMALLSALTLLPVLRRAPRIGA